MTSPTWRLLRNRPFRRLVLGQAVSAVGDGMHQVAFLWLVYKLSSSAAETSLILAAATLPYFLFGLVGGALADRWPHRRILLASHALRAGAVALLAAAAAGDALIPLHLGAVAFLLTSVRCIYYPTFKAACASVLPPEDLQRGNAAAIAAIKTMHCLGPAAGGLVLAALPIATVFTADALTYLGAWLTVLGVRLAPLSAVDRPPLLGGVGFALKTMLQSPALRIAVGAHCAALLLLTGPTLVAYPQIADRIWGTGAAGLGVGMTLKGVACAATYALLSRCTMRRPERWTLTGLLVWSSAAAVIVTAPSYAGALVGFALEGAAIALMEGPISYLLQVEVRMTRVGVMFGVWSTASFACEALSAPLGGLPVALFGPIAPVLTSAGLIAAIAGVILTCARRVRAHAA